MTVPPATVRHVEDRNLVCACGVAIGVLGFFRGCPCGWKLGRCAVCFRSEVTRCELRLEREAHVLVCPDGSKPDFDPWAVTPIKSIFGSARAIVAEAPIVRPERPPVVSKVRDAIMAELDKDGELRPSEIAARLGLKLPTLSWHLAKLRDDGQVVARRSGHSWIYARKAS